MVTLTLDPVWIGVFLALIAVLVPLMVRSRDHGNTLKTHLNDAHNGIDKINIRLDGMDKRSDDRFSTLKDLIMSKK